MKALKARFQYWPVTSHEAIAECAEADIPIDPNFEDRVARVIKTLGFTCTDRRWVNTDKGPSRCLEFEER